MKDEKGKGKRGKMWPLICWLTTDMERETSSEKLETKCLTIKRLPLLVFRFSFFLAPNDQRPNPNPQHSQATQLAFIPFRAEAGEKLLLGRFVGAFDDDLI